MSHPPVNSKSPDGDEILTDLPNRQRRRDNSWKFLRQWVKHPFRTAAMLPSSPALARLMAAGVNANSGQVVELGPGTGAVTEALLQTGINPANLWLVELNADFARLLQQQYPALRVLHANAGDLNRLMPEASVTTVISSLPMISLPHREQERVLMAALAVLQPGGALYQFSYSKRFPIPRQITQAMGLEVQCVGGTLRNLPPAWVFRLTRSLPN